MARETAWERSGKPESHGTGEKMRSFDLAGRFSPRSVIAAGAVALTTAVLAAPAPAAPLHSPAPFPPITGAGIGTSFGKPLSVAVDESTGNIFVPGQVFHEETSHAEYAVYILGSEGGTPVGVAPPYKITDPAFNFGVDFNIPAVDNSPTSPSKGALYVPIRSTSLSSGAVRKYVRNPATEQYELAEELTSVPGLGATEAVTVDNEGNVYVASVNAPEAELGLITKFSPTGVQLARIVMTKATRSPESIAVDEAGNLFVVTGDFKVFKFPADGLGEIEASNFVEIPQFGQPNGVAVDRPSNTLFVANGGRTVEYDATSLVEKGEFSFPGSGEDYRALVAVNHAAGLIYVPRTFQQRDISAFTLGGPTLPDAGAGDEPSPLSVTKATLNGIVNPEGLAIGECKFVFDVGSGPGTDLPCEGALPADSSPHQVTAQLSGLAPYSNHNYRLVVSNANGTNQSARKFFTTEPIAKTEPASAISPAGATLNGVVRPEGSPLSECRFEYGLTTAYGSSVPCSPEAGAIPADTAPHSVSADLSGLLVGTTYHYRLVAAGALGPENGEDLSFTTLGPTVKSIFFSALTETSVTLEALVNPQGKQTAYHFEYGSQGPCAANPCTSAPVPDAPLGTPTSNLHSDLTAATPIEGLSPKTTYYFRIVASNPDGTGHSSESSFTTYDVAPTFGACPNDAFRSGRPSAALPDCRAYEQATPIDKNGGDAGGALFKVQASLSGDGITSQTQGGLPGAEGAQQHPIFLSRRGPSGWSTQGFLPPPSFGERAVAFAWTPDLAYSFSKAAFAASDVGEGTDNALLMRSSTTHAIQQITPYLNQAEYAFAGASADASKIFFEASGPTVNLTGNAATGHINPFAYKDNLYLYDRASEEVSLVGVLPDGSTPNGGSFAGPYGWWWNAGQLQFGGALGIGQEGNHGYLTQELHAISADGDKAFFSAGLTGQLYLRRGLDGEAPETVQVSASQRSTFDPGGPKPAAFLAATPDASTVFFASCQKLTDDSTAHSTAEENCTTLSQGQDLYAYDTESGELRDLTVDSEDALGAQVKGLVGISNDGSYVYFVANGDLDGPGGPAQPGNCEVHGDIGNGGSLEASGECNLYLWHEGTVKWIARLDRSDAPDWRPGGEEQPTTGRVSADGKVVVFSGLRYDAEDERIACVTCNPTGAPPQPYDAGEQNIEAGVNTFSHPLETRFVSASGDQVFFQTAQKLVAADTDGDHGCPAVYRPSVPVASCQDVYEWEAPQAGSCSEASSAYSALDEGCLYLLSVGTSHDPAFFADASASGNDVFIFSGEQLVPTDQDHLFDVYDVHVDGGLASQNPPPAPVPCEGDACRGPGSSPPAAQSPGSAGFQGAGNPTPTPHKHKKHHKKHHKKKHHKKHKKHHKAKAKKRAGQDEGGRK
jgi:hypothetical protein